MLELMDQSADPRCLVPLQIQETKRIVGIAQTDDAFSTETGLERAGFAGPIRWLWALDSSTKKKTKKKRIGGGSPIAASIPKSVLSCGREYQLLRE